MRIRVKVWGGDIERGPIITHSSALPSTHTIGIQALSPLSNQHPAPRRSSSSHHLALPALNQRDHWTTIQGLRPEMTKQWKNDPGNGDVASPDPLTSNPSPICLYCLVCSRGARSCRLRRMRMLWGMRVSTQGPKVTLSLTGIWVEQVKHPIERNSQSVQQQSLSISSISEAKPPLGPVAVQ